MSFSNFTQTALIAILFVARLSESQTCDTGCLICGSNSKCKACDTPNFYALSDGKCTQATSLENCSSIDSEGKCLSCTGDFYVDTTTQKCVALEALYKITNCTVYNSGKVCISCKPGFYILNSICVGSGTPISNCEVQSDETTCLTCKIGFLMNIDYTECVSPPSGISNCMSFGFVKCKTCASGYLLDFNKYIRDFQTALTSNASADTLVTTVNKKSSKDLNNGLLTACYQLTMTGCSEYKNPSKCKKCFGGYYLDEKFTCQPNPAISISSCKVYTSATVCDECDSGYFLDSPNLCIKVVEISGCQSYDSTASKSVCVACIDSYYLSYEGVCLLRTRTSIKDCSTYDLYDDKCFACPDGYQLTSDGYSCLPSISKCETYATSNVSTISHSCGKCSQGYYLVGDSSCKQGTIESCKTYEADQNYCSVCADGYYLESQEICSPHKTFTNCGVYDPKIQDKCLKCNNKSVMSSISNRCAEATEIPGCLRYLSETTCETCNTGYFLESVEKTCTVIPSTMNCLKATNLTTCTKCKMNYLLYNNVCIAVPVFVTEGCETNNLMTGGSSLETAKCLSCNSTSMAWDLDDQFMCLENEWVTALQPTAITHCLQYDMSDGDAICIRCSDGYYLSANKCVNACPTDEVIILSEIITSSSKYEINRIKICSANTFSGKIDHCQIYAHPNNIVDGDVNSNHVCVKCKSGYGAVVDLTSPNSTGMETASLVENLSWKFSSAVTFMPKVHTCINLTTSAATTTLLAPANTNIIDGCEYYVRVGATTKYGCVRCTTGKRGLLSSTTDGHYIASCTTTSCEATVVPGLQAQLNSLVSCYKCTDQSLIPFLFINGGSTYTTISGYKSYNLEAASADWDSVTSGGYNVGCYSKTGSGFTSVTSFNLPANCSIGAFNVASATASASNANKTSLTSTANLAVFCLACNQGYKRSFATDSSNAAIPYMVYECTIIDNCLVKDLYNYCSLCNNNFAFLYDDTHGVDYTSCVAYAIDANCLATYAKDSGPCAICKKGYVLNLDGVCEALAVPFCNDGEYDPRRTFKRLDFNTIFYISPLGAGCNSCKNGFYPTLLDFSITVCANSTYLAKLYTMKTTKYILNCTNYTSESGSIKCTRCGPGYVMKSNKIECLPSTQLSFCAVASSNTDCVSCIDGYINLSGKCKKTNIDNCTSFDSGSSVTKQTCQDCAAGYYLLDNKCVSGQIPHCTRYKINGEGCSKCAEAYQLVKAGNIDYCFKIPTDFNCNKYDEDKFRLNVLECKTCSTATPLFLTTTFTTESQSTCQTLEEITNCDSYMNYGSFSSSTLLCDKCGLAAYNSKGTCKLRTVNPDSCNEYDDKDDKCKACKLGSYASKGQCVLNPVGVQNCLINQKDNVCSVCKQNYYPSESKCISVPSENLISNCLYYRSADTCSECKSGYALSDNKCPKSQAMDCLTVRSITECASCSPNRGVKAESGLTNCVLSIDSNCTSFIQTSFPFKCTVCKLGFYPGSDGVCTAITKSIDNCDLYDSATTCHKCFKGLALSSTKDKCLNSGNIKKLISSTCESSTIESAAVCGQCDSGYTFDESGNCVKTCKDGCHFCDIDSPDTCLICASGNSMSTQGSCSVSAIDNSGTDFGEISSIWTAFAMLTLLIRL